mgnify:CR=1 FL=1
MNAQDIEIIKENIRSIPNFPKEGILFRDVTTLMNNSEAFKLSLALLASYLKNDSVDYIAGIESRGFIFGAPLAQMLGVGFVPIRKKGKLPCEVHQVEYELEYGTDILEIDRDFDAASKKIVLIDDLLATGGTVVAATKLIRMCKGEVLKALFVVDLPELGASKKLNEHNIPYNSLISYEGH